MLELENPQDQAMKYAFHIHRINVDDVERKLETDWSSVVVPSSVKLATDPQNPLAILSSLIKVLKWT